MDSGTGFLGTIVRLKVGYDSADTVGPRSIIAKFSSGELDMRRYGKRSYEREVRFYQNMSAESRLPVPRCYYAAIDTNSGWHVILLEDLAPARSGTRAIGCTPSRARIAIHRLAQFHGYWWENPKLDDIDWLTEPTTIPDDAEVARAHNEWWPDFLRRVGEILPDEMIELGEVFGEHKGWVSRHLQSRPRTLLHGDYHMENLLFGAAGTETFYVVDWHFMGRGAGISDVGRFLAGSLTPETRRAVEMDLLRDYVRILNEHGVSGYNFEDVLYDYHMWLLMRFGTLISSIVALPFTEEQRREIIEVGLRRGIAAVMDNDCRSLLTQHQ